MEPLPIGYRFSPTDSELILYYLNQKVMGKPTPTNDISEADLYKLSPLDLPGVGTKNKRVFYFFTKRKKQQTEEERRKTRTGSGYWKPTSSLDEEIIDRHAMKMIGMKRSLVYSAIDREMTAASNDTNPKWTMKEYSTLMKTQKAVKEEEEWVICKITKKKSACTNKSKVKIAKKKKKSASSKKAEEEEEEEEDDDDDDDEEEEEEEEEEGCKQQKAKKAKAKHPSSANQSRSLMACRSPNSKRH